MPFMYLANDNLSDGGTERSMQVGCVEYIIDKSDYSNVQILSTARLPVDPRVKIESEEDARCISPGSWWSCETDSDISVARFESQPNLIGIRGKRYGDDACEVKCLLCVGHWHDRVGENSPSMTSCCGKVAIEWQCGAAWPAWHSLNNLGKCIDTARTYSRFDLQALRPSLVPYNPQNNTRVFIFLYTSG